LTDFQNPFTGTLSGKFAIRRSLKIPALHIKRWRYDKKLQTVYFLPIVLLHSRIGYWHHHVVRPSVCNAVHCGSRTLLLLDVSFSIKTHRKMRVEENASVSFLRQRKPRVHWFRMTTWEDRHRELCSSRLSGLSLGAFIKI